MTTSATILRTVVGYDFTELADHALAMAAALSGTYDSELHVVSVLEASLVSRGLIEAVDYPNAEALQHGLSLVTDALPSRFPMDHTVVHTHARIGDPAEEIVQLASELYADLIVVGARNREGLERWLSGSVAETITRTAACPVLCARPKNYAVDTQSYAPEPSGPPMMTHRLEPHVYHYTQRIAPSRPAEWPLY